MMLRWKNTRRAGGGCFLTQRNPTRFLRTSRIYYMSSLLLSPHRFSTTILPPDPRKSLLSFPSPMHNTHSLTRLGINFTGGAFGSHFALNPYRLAPRRRSCSFGLFRLLLALGRRLLLFPLTYSLETGFSPLACALTAALFDHVQRSSHNSPLLLDSASGSLFRDFLVGEGWSVSF